MQVYQISGTIGTILLCLLLMPQVWHTYQSKDVSGLSPHFIALNLLASACLLWYGIGIGIDLGWPLIVSNTLMIVNSLLLAIMFRLYSIEGANTVQNQTIAKEKNIMKKVEIFV